MITCVVKNPSTKQEIIVSFIYAVNWKYGRQALWEEICGLAREQNVASKPWALMGDFNQVINPVESSQGGSRIKKGMVEFRDCIEYAGLFDLSFRGNHFTWWNKQDSNPLAKKLDHILINDVWQLSFPYSYAHFGDPDCSDHSPGTICYGNMYRAKKPFIFSQFLPTHEDFLPRVTEFWN